MLQPGIDVARRGFTVDQTFFDQTTPAVDYFDDVPSTAAIYLDPDGTPRDVGSTLRNPDLAKTYELIARSGAAGVLQRPDRPGDGRAPRSGRRSPRTPTTPGGPA